VLLLTGLNDTVCPPSTQYAAFNKITAPKRHVLYPDYGHEMLPGSSDLIYEFLGAL
jgi:cephalosporin-C deacetylase